MSQFKMFILGCGVVCVITVLVNVMLRKHPAKADRVIGYIIFALLAVLINYAVWATDWMPVKEKLSKDLQEYQETQRKVWK